MQNRNKESELENKSTKQDLEGTGASLAAGVR